MRKSIQSIEKALKNHGIECRYNDWPADDSALTKTYATIQVVGSNNMPADDSVYEHVFSFELDLFTSSKNIDAEESVMAALDELGTPYQSTEYYNTTNKSYQIQFTFELVEEKES
jgi:hypothetical protein